MANPVPPDTEEQLKVRLVQHQVRQARRKARIVGLVAGGLAAWFFIYIFLFAGSGEDTPPGRVEGRLHLALASRRQVTLELDDYGCSSGWPQRFRGVILQAPDGAWRVRLEADEVGGHSVRVTGEGHRLVFGPEQCTRLELALRDEPGRRDDGLAYHGSVRIDCESDRGALRGKAGFKDCYQ